MATVPQISSSASIEDKQKHIVKHAASVPMLNMLLKNKMLKLEDLDNEATDEMLMANGWLCLDEISVDDVIISTIGSKVDTVSRVDQKFKDAIALKGYQATQGLVKLTFSTTLMLHARHDTDTLAQEITDFVNSKVTIDA